MSNNKFDKLKISWYICLVFVLYWLYYDSNHIEDMMIYPQIVLIIILTFTYRYVFKIT